MSKIGFTPSEHKEKVNGMGGGGGAAPLYINITQPDGSTYEKDLSYAEIKQAYDSGRAVFCNYYGTIASIHSIPGTENAETLDADGSVVFTGVQIGKSDISFYSFQIIYNDNINATIHKVAKM